VVAHLVGDGAQEEPAGARHALVADDDEVVVALVGHLDERGGRVTVVDTRIELDAGLGVAGRFAVDDLLGLLAGAGGENGEGRTRGLGQLDGPVDGLGRRLRTVRADEDPLVHGRRR
jgi:hypothetical protein